jgi:hypothetical protein
MMSVFSEFIRILHAEVNDKSIILKYQEETEVSFSDIILNIMSDTLSDLRIYESHVFEHPEELEKHQRWILKLIQSIPFNKYVYLNDKIILMHLLPNIDIETKSMILRKAWARMCSCVPHEVLNSRTWASEFSGMCTAWPTLQKHCAAKRPRQAQSSPVR